MTHPTFRYTTKVYGHTLTISANSDITDTMDLIGMHLIGVKIPTDGTNFVKANIKRFN